MSDRQLESELLGNKRYTEINTFAIRYLSRRDYSRRELHHKLLAQSFPPEGIEAVLNDLAEKDYQSDQRFAEMFLRSRVSRGDGPFKIKLALTQKGIAETLIQQLLEESDINWFAEAHKARQKHFGTQLPNDTKSLSKQMRYLRNKGFYQEHIDAAIRADTDMSGA